MGKDSKGKRSRKGRSYLDKEGFRNDRDDRNHRGNKGRAEEDMEKREERKQRQNRGQDEWQERIGKRVKEVVIKYIKNRFMEREQWRIKYWKIKGKRVIIAEKRTTRKGISV